jgi:hypothetical protein
MEDERYYDAQLGDVNFNPEHMTSSNVEEKLMCFMGSSR